MSAFAVWIGYCVVYLAAGAFMGGLASDNEDVQLLWTPFWPVMLILSLVALPRMAGEWIAERWWR